MTLIYPKKSKKEIQNYLELLFRSLKEELELTENAIIVLAEVSAYYIKNSEENYLKLIELLEKEKRKEKEQLKKELILLFNNSLNCNN